MQILKALEVETPLLGFDTNAVVGPRGAQFFADAGYRFAARYLPRVTQHKNDLTADEVLTLHSFGMAVVGVQHVESETSWIPDGQKGADYGRIAAKSALLCRLPLDTNVYCDLEGVNVDVDPSEIMTYCHEWYQQVHHEGYTPGLYVGWHCGLTPQQLDSLPFTHYWGAYNLNSDEQPLVGVSMQQHISNAPAGSGYEIDSDTVKPDKKGRLPIMCVPDNWEIVTG